MSAEGAARYFDGSFFPGLPLFGFEPPPADQSSPAVPAVFVPREMPAKVSFVPRYGLPLRGLAAALAWAEPGRVRNAGR